MVVLAASGLGALLLAPVLAVEVDDMSTPTAAQAHLPSGMEIAEQSTECASGGCWLRLALTTEDLAVVTQQDLLEMHGRCQAVSMLDRRQVCVSAQRDASVLVVDLSFKRSLGL